MREFGRGGWHNPTAFAFVSGVAFDCRGNILVGDAKQNLIRVRRGGRGWGEAGGEDEGMLQLFSVEGKLIQSALVFQKLEGLPRSQAPCIFPAGIQLSVIPKQSL